MYCSHSLQGRIVVHPSPVAKRAVALLVGDLLKHAAIYVLREKRVSCTVVSIHERKSALYEIPTLGQ
jgi:hypothetical protein